MSSYIDLIVALNFLLLRWKRLNAVSIYVLLVTENATLSSTHTHTHTSCACINSEQQMHLLAARTDFTAFVVLASFLQFAALAFTDSRFSSPTYILKQNRKRSQLVRIKLFRSAANLPDLRIIHFTKMANIASNLTKLYKNYARPRSITMSIHTLLHVTTIF